MRIERFVALSDHWFARLSRVVYRAITQCSLPAPRAIIRPILQVFLVLRWFWYFVIRVLVCEPFFKSYCVRYGRNVRTGARLHWVMGNGEIFIGSDVLLDGKSSFCFAVRYSSKPTLIIGDHCYVGHGCDFTVGKQITIGNHCYIAGGVRMLDAPGHPTDPAARRARLPAPVEKVRPIVIGDNVWIGAYATILPGVEIGEGSVVGTGSVVTKAVPPYTLVVGNPACRIRALAPELKSLTHT